MSLTQSLTFFLLVLSFLALTNAQFPFFEGMFGQPQQQQHHQPPGGQQWAMHAESLSCSEYLCPDTLVCVTKPVDCPCPNVQDIKCVVPDAQAAGSGTRFCVRGSTGCEQVEKLAKKFSK
ncbi:hypothetical protein BGW80DRAFT_1174572 [Lactifluus volemus]|nr:hypothetical protein BGW80DRAFT_1174572 [Lactifluus volemus]